MLKEEIRYDELKEQADEKQQENEQLEREKKQLVHEYDTLSMRVAVKQLDYEEADERVKEANERADRIEAYIKTQSDTLVDLEHRRRCSYFNIVLRNTMKYHKNTLKAQNICAILLIVF